MDYTTQKSDVSLAAIIITVLSSLPIIIILTWLSTTISYRTTISRNSSTIKSNSQKTPSRQKPARIPYAVPWLGSALSFLNQRPGSFWQFYLKTILPDSHGASTLLLGGDTIHVISSPAAIQTAFKSRSMTRDPFTRKIMQYGLGVSKEDIFKGVPIESPPQELDMEKVMHEQLLNPDAVKVTVRNFTKMFRQQLASVEGIDQGKTLILYDWFKGIMFNASTAALMGTKILELNPRLGELYWTFDEGMLTRFYGIPQIFSSGPYRALDDLAVTFSQWHELLSDHQPDLESDWTSLEGSKLVRYRHKLYNGQGLSTRGKAGFDMGLLFGFASNSIAISGWLLFHLLSPTTPRDVLPRVLAELESVRRPGQELDPNALGTLPLFNSALHETLRMYVDVLVTRELTSSHHLGHYSYDRNEVIMMPSYLAHHDEAFWARNTDWPSSQEWYAERFVRSDESGKAIFSVNGAAGNFFPFGGGKQICPGRLFAKHEMLISVAIILLEYDMDFLEFVDWDGKSQLVGRGRDEAAFPYIKRQFAGNGAVLMGGDMRISIKRKA